MKQLEFEPMLMWTLQAMPQCWTLLLIIPVYACIYVLWMKHLNYSILTSTIELLSSKCLWYSRHVLYASNNQKFYRCDGLCSNKGNNKYKQIISYVLVSPVIKVDVIKLIELWMSIFWILKIWELIISLPAEVTFQHKPQWREEMSYENT